MKRSKKKSLKRKENCDCVECDSCGIRKPWFEMVQYDLGEGVRHLCYDCYPKVLLPCFRK